MRKKLKFAPVLFGLLLGSFAFKAIGADNPQAYFRIVINSTHNIA